MNRKHLTALLALTLLALAGLLACTQQQPIADSQLSLRKGDLEQPTTVIAPKYTEQGPYETKPGPAAFYGAPPMIPHSIADMVVTREQNDCLDCHEEGDADTPSIPPSHRIKADVESPARQDVHRAMVTQVDGFHRVRRVAGNRYNCTQCHAPQAENAAPVVANAFVPERPDDSALKDVLKGLNEKGDY